MEIENKLKIEYERKMMEKLEEVKRKYKFDNEKIKQDLALANEKIRLLETTQKN